MFKSFSDDKGFTLIELLVVILIIAILVAVALPNFLGQQDKANDSAQVQYLTVAYKAAKAAVTTNDDQGEFGLFGTGTTVAAVSSDLANAIETSETGNAPVTGTDAVAEFNGASVTVAVSANAAGADLTLSSTSKSGNACSLVAESRGGLTSAADCS